MFLKHFRELVFAYSTVTSNAIPVFYNSFECFQVFAGLYVRWERIPNFWSRRINLKISLMKDGFVEFILL